METNSRPLTDLERETWDAYEAVLKMVPNYNAYDRVSIHEAFPDVKAAFEKCVALRTYYRLTQNYDEDM